MVLSTHAISTGDGYLRLPLSHAFMKAHPKARETKFPFPPRIDGRSVREVRMIPAHNARFLAVEFVSNNTGPVDQPSLNKNRIPGTDPGVNRLAACASTTGQVFIIDGRVPKAVNQWYNKERARLQSIKDRPHTGGEPLKTACLAANRENFTTDYLRKAARHISDFCVSHGIGTLVAGVNTGQKQNIDIAMSTTRTSWRFRFWKFRRLLKNLCERYGILYVEIEESYTSRASFLDRDKNHFLLGNANSKTPLWT